MKRYQFPLKGFLQVKIHEENSALAQYADAAAQLSRARHAAVDLKRRLVDEWRKHQETLNTGAATQQLVLQQNGWNYIEQQITQAEAAITQAEDQLEESAVKLKTVQTDRESLENYRRESRRNHITEEERLEQVELDELASRGRSKRY